MIYGDDPYDLAEFVCPYCERELIAPWERCCEEKDE